MTKLIITIVGLTVLSSVAANAAICGDRGAVLKTLTKEYHQKPVAVGIVDDKVMELYAAPDGQWTMLLSDKKQTCIYGFGTDLNTVKFVKGEDL